MIKNSQNVFFQKFEFRISRTVQSPVVHPVVLPVVHFVPPEGHSIILVSYKFDIEDPYIYPRPLRTFSTYANDLKKIHCVDFTVLQQ